MKQSDTEDKKEKKRLGFPRLLRRILDKISAFLWFQTYQPALAWKVIVGIVLITSFCLPASTLDTKAPFPGPFPIEIYTPATGIPDQDILLDTSIYDLSEYENSGSESELFQSLRIRSKSTEYFLGAWL
jgi:hypothetical protein